jgi:hypothetical protein
MSVLPENTIAWIAVCGRSARTPLLERPSQGTVTSVIDLEPLAKTAATVLVPLLAAIRIGGRRGRLRKEIRENLTLVHDLEQDPVLREHTPAAAWLQGKIAIDVARLAGHPLGTPKRPLPVGSMILSGVLGLLFGVLTWYIDRDGFVWYSVFPGVASALLRRLPSFRFGA